MASESMLHLNWGGDQGTLKVARKRLVGHFRGPEGKPLADPSAVVRERLAAPLGAPPWVRALTPDDRVTIVLESGLADFAPLVAPILDTLAEAGVADRNVTILLTTMHPPTRGQQVTEWLARHRPEVALATHDAAQAESLVYLASTPKGNRVYLDRQVVDADAILTVGRAGFDSVTGYRGTAANLFPTLADRAAGKRSRMIAIEAGALTDTLRARQECEEVGWLAGLYYSAMVALDRAHRIEEVWVGEARSVQEAADRHTREAWTALPATGRCDLVLARVSPSEEASTWESLAAALETAHALAGPEGRIALMTDLQAPLGESGRWLADSENPWEILARLRQSDAADAVATAQLARVIAARKVFLMSPLPTELVESCSLVPLASAKEVQRLIDRSTGCYVLEDADRARAEAPSHS